MKLNRYFPVAVYPTENTIHSDFPVAYTARGKQRSNVKVSPVPRGNFRGFRVNNISSHKMERESNILGYNYGGQSDPSGAGQFLGFPGN